MPAKPLLIAFFQNEKPELHLVTVTLVVRVDSGDMGLGNVHEMLEPEVYVAIASLMWV